MRPGVVVLTLRAPYPISHIKNGRVNPTHGWCIFFFQTLVHSPVGVILTMLRTGCLILGWTPSSLHFPLNPICDHTFSGKSLSRLLSRSRCSILYKPYSVRHRVLCLVIVFGLCQEHIPCLQIVFPWAFSLGPLRLATVTALGTSPLICKLSQAPLGFHSCPLTLVKEPLEWHRPSRLQGFPTERPLQILNLSLFCCHGQASLRQGRAKPYPLVCLSSEVDSSPCPIPCQKLGFCLRSQTTGWDP